MHPKPNKFLTVLFSFIPGAGHMYFGLMKRGISFMAIFCVSLVGVFFFDRYFNFLSLSVIAIFAVPLVWFVSFFDFWRYPRMSAEERLALKDDFIMPSQRSIPRGPLLRKAQVIAGIVLILGGAVEMFRQFVLDYLVQNFWQQHPRITDFMFLLPRLFGAVLIIVVGLLLIFWKGRQIKKEAREGTYDAE